MIPINIHKKKKTRGFTLIEVIIAIGILATSLTAAMSLVQRGYSSTFTARDQITAFYLAQDAIEQIRAIRNTNKLNLRTNTTPYTPDYWLAGLDGTAANPLCISPGGTAHCKLDNFDDQGNLDFRVTVCPLISGQPACGGPLKYISTNGLYGYRLSSLCTSGSCNSRFFRDIVIISPNESDSNEAKVMVKVTWIGSGGSTKSVVINEYMRNL